MADKYIVQRRTASGLEVVAELPVLEDGKIGLSWLPVVGTMGSAIIEHGSNANGEYVKFADGTMWCWRQLYVKTENISTVSWGATGLYRYSSMETFPASFISAPIVAAAGGSNQITYGLITPESISTTQVEFTIFTTTATPTVTNIGYIAIGRWK